MASHFTRYLFDDRKLRDRGLLQLARALRDDRMVAVVGTMATEASGYGDWKAFMRRVGGIALTLHGEMLAAAQDTDAGRAIAFHAGRLTARQDDKAVAMPTPVEVGLLREAFDAVDRDPRASWPRPLPSAGEAPAPSWRARFDRKVAALFMLPGAPPDPKLATQAPVIRWLIEGLGLRRFATLNYDLEIERALMLSPKELVDLQSSEQVRRDQGDGPTPLPPPHPFHRTCGPPGSGALIGRDESGRRLSRQRADGTLIQSDILDRERPDHLFEFAVGSSEVDYHILHLHGRADQPSSMTVDIADYDLLYRLDDVHRNPFQHGLRALFSGNPVILVGLGMTEAELNAFFQYMVSNSPFRRSAPIFLLWNTLDAAKYARGANGLTGAHAMRVDYLRRLGVHVIFDRDLRGYSAARISDGPGAPPAATDWLPLVWDRYDEAVAAGDADRLRAVQLQAVEAMLERLPGVVRWHWQQADQEVASQTRLAGGNRRPWRSMADKIDDVAKKTEPMRLWGATGLARHGRTCLTKLTGDATAIRPSRDDHETVPTMLVGIGGAGSGRGLLAEVLLQHDLTGDYALPTRNGSDPWLIRGCEPANRILVNAGFGYDSDSILGSLDLFLQKRGRSAQDNGDDPEAPPVSRELRFYDGAVFRNKPAKLVIVNGVDRFFAFDGSLLSAEFDQLFRSILKHRAGAGVQWLLLGTARIEAYFRTIGADVRYTDDLALSSRLDRFARNGQEPDGLRSKYLSSVAHAIAPKPPRGRSALTDAADGRIANAQRVDRSGIPRAFFAGILDEAQLRASELEPDVVFAVLRTMAFVGEPVPVCVLCHAPAVLAALRDSIDVASRAEAISGTIDQLVAWNVVLEIEPFDRSTTPMEGAEGALSSGQASQGGKSMTPPEGAEGTLAPGDDPSPKSATEGAEDVFDLRRVGLHRSLVTELRNRLGVPLGASKLSTSFNMSLFVAQPTDSAKPDPALHRELGELVDHLIGASKDAACAVSSADAETLETHRMAAVIAFSPHPDDQNGHAAANRILRFCHPHVVPCLRAALSVIRGYYSTTSLLTYDPQSHGMTEEGALTEHTERLDRLLKTYGRIVEARRIVTGVDGIALAGPEPFYADDLVWLHNERGVAKLAQGDLYDARRSLSLAAEANRSHLEGSYLGHNWRRITLNLVSLYIERGRLTDAERLIDEVEATIDRNSWERQDAGQAAEPIVRRRTDRIIADFGDQADHVQDFTSPLYTREEIMTVGITTGYRGLIAFLRGRLRDARERYAHGITILRRIGEQRAYALFQRHYATVHRTPDEIMRQTALAIKASGSIHQDIAHRAKVLRAAFIRRVPTAGLTVRSQALRDMHDALRYAAATDAYRVRIEASTALAREMRRSGDYDTALQYAADAIAIASRYGHTLHKLTLRIEIGRILIQRGDPLSGAALLDRAVLTATKLGFGQIAEYGQRRDWDNAEHPLPSDSEEG